MERAITFYYAIGSRYSYLASTQIDSLAERHDCTVNWIPVEGFELRSLTSADPFRAEARSGQYQSPYRENDLAAWASYYDVPYQEPPSGGDELWWENFDFRPLARAAVAGFMLGQTAKVSKLLYASMFASNEWSMDEATCIECAVSAGIDRDTFVATLARDDIDATLSKNAAQALAKGAFGVPSFLIDDQLFFGNDRLVLLEHHLKHRQ